MKRRRAKAELAMNRAARIGPAEDKPAKTRPAEDKPAEDKPETRMGRGRATIGCNST
jgi:hypothetical protein